MPALLTAIMVWLSANFGLPANYDLPRIERMSAIEMQNFVYHDMAADQRAAMAVDQMRRVHSLYSAATKTIYLLPEWNGRTPADLSLLVHEMVHHLQNISLATFPCPQARERLAHEAQDKWLSLFGHSLLSDFGMDRTSVVLSTACME